MSSLNTNVEDPLKLIQYHEMDIVYEKKLTLLITIFPKLFN